MAGTSANLWMLDKRGYGQVKGREPTPKQCPIKKGDGMQRTKTQSPCIIHAAKVKQIPECATESDKRRGNGERVKVRKVMDSDGSGACTQGSGTAYLNLANTGEVGHRSNV